MPPAASRKRPLDSRSTWVPPRSRRTCATSHTCVRVHPILTGFPVLLPNLFGAETIPLLLLDCHGLKLPRSSAIVYAIKPAEPMPQATDQPHKTDPALALFQPIVDLWTDVVHHFECLVRFPGQTFFQTLRRKLKWGDLAEREGG